MRFHQISLTTILIAAASISYLMFGCKPQAIPPQKEKIAKVYLRLRKDFYCISVKPNGEANIEVGRGSGYTEPFVKISSCTSQNFCIDSATQFWSVIHQLKDSPFVMRESHTVPRVEVHYDTTRICDTYIWHGLIWDLIRPIIENPPKGFNPLLPAESPFFQNHH